MAGATFDLKQVVLESSVKDSLDVLDPIAHEKNIEVTMRVLAKTLSGRHHIIIDDPQILKLNVLRIMIIREAETMR
jgi:hypothetical protein